MMKKVFFSVSLFLVLLVPIGIVKANLVANSEDIRLISEQNKKESGVLNPLWEYYDGLSDEEKANWEVVPEKYIIEYKTEVNPFSNYSYGSAGLQTALASSYDLRDVGGNNYVTPVKDQASTGLCWAFATNSSIESNILKLGLRTSSNPAIFSERQIDYLSAYPMHNLTISGNRDIQVYEEGYNPYSLNRNLADGGNFYLTAFYYGMGIAPAKMQGVWETFNERFDTVSLKDVYDENLVDYVVIDYVQFPWINNLEATEATKTSWRNMIKEHISNYGAVYIGSLAPQNSSSGACYIGDVSDGIDLVNWNTSCLEGNTAKPYNGTHAMSIIGWDDDYTASYCSYYSGYSSASVSESECTANDGTYTTVNGAWIVKNSWGPYSDYIHIAYDSYFLEADGIINTIEKDFDNTYNYLGPIYYRNLANYSTEHIYKKSSNKEYLSRISFETDTTTSTVYDVYFATASNHYYQKIGSTTVSNPGRYSVSFSGKEIDDETFVIRIKPSISSDGAKPINIFAFTTNDNNSESATTILSTISSYDTNTSLYSYNILTRAYNVSSGEEITYKLKNINGLEINTIVDNKYYIVAGASSNALYTTRALPDGIYYIETYHNNNLIGKNSFAIGIDLEGNGTETTPYLIKKSGDLNYLITNNYSNYYYKLVNDIDLTGVDFSPLGYGINESFYGTLDGDGHKITGLNQTGDYVGLFYNLKGTVENIIIEGNLNTAISGGFLASLASYATIENIFTKGKITTQNDTATIGGIIGSMENSTIEKSYNSASISGGVAGSFVGYLGSSSSIDNSFNIGEVASQNSTVSTFIGSVAFENNSLDYLIDYSGREYVGCIDKTTSYDTSNLSYSNIVYYGNNCTYLGTKANDTSLRNVNTYSNFSTNIWNIVNGKYPTLKSSNFVFANSLDANLNDTLFIGTTAQLYTELNPEEVTIPKLKYESSNPDVLTVNDDGNVITHGSGKCTITVSTTDATRLSSSIDVYVFSDDFKNKVRDEKYIYVKDTEMLDEFKNNWKINDLDLETSVEEKLGTGSIVTYKIGDNVVGEFTVIVKGDISGDGEIASNDLLMMRRYILELDELTEAQKLAGNVNGYGISSANILLIRRYILGLEGEL